MQNNNSYDNPDTEKSTSERSALTVPKHSKIITGILAIIILFIGTFQLINGVISFFTPDYLASSSVLFKTASVIFGLILVIHAYGLSKYKRWAAIILIGQMLISILGNFYLITKGWSILIILIMQIVPVILTLYYFMNIKYFKQPKKYSVKIVYSLTGIILIFNTLYLFGSNTMYGFSDLQTNDAFPQNSNAEMNDEYRPFDPNETIDEYRRRTNYNKADNDNDGLNNLEEYNWGTDPDNPDTDNDGLNDYNEVKSVTDPLKADSDEDGLNDWDEINIWHTAPDKSDTDGDGYLDGDEVKNGFDPRIPGNVKLK